MDGITVYRRDVSGSPIVALRGEGIVNASILRVASVIVDNQRAPEWVDSVAEVHTLRTTGEAESVEWDHVKTPIQYPIRWLRRPDTCVANLSMANL